MLIGNIVIAIKQITVSMSNTEIKTHAEPIASFCILDYCNVVVFILAHLKD